MYKFCNKCGNITLGDKYLEERCSICGKVMIPVPINLIQENDILTDKELEDIIEELVKTSPEFDQYLFDHRDEILAKQSAELNAKMEHGKAVLEERARIPKCPSCGSSNISKIGVMGRAVSFSLVGFASSKIGKTHKCNNCGTTW